MRRTKIVCTIGPSSEAPEIVRELITGGMDVARLNFSHGSHDDHRRAFDTIRGLADECECDVAVMMDLQGPKIRTGRLENGAAIDLDEGQALCVTTRDVLGTAGLISTTYTALPDDVRPEDRILLADGTIELRVEKVAPPDVHCTVVHGGALGEHKGINLPGVEVSAPSLTEKDLADLEFGLSLGVDYVALSFVRSPDDIRAVKRHIEAAGKNTHVVAKIERPEAVERFDEILELTDAVMVARGDLGVEMDLDEVPQIQKQLIRKCNDRGVPVITATQMLESMMTNPRPTRAEVTDVANAIYDGTDAVMLSGETAAGKFPLRAVRVMASIANRTDTAIGASPPREAVSRLRSSGIRSGSFSEAIGQAVCRMTQVLDVKRIVCFTMSGHTARAIARFRPNTPITALTINEETRRRCALNRGVDAIQADEVNHTDEMVRMVDRIITDNHLANAGDTVVIVAGMPLAVGGRTNLLKLHTVSEE